jgi:hypothetical protein
MSQHEHQHGHSHEHGHEHGHPHHPAKRALHKDWRAWVVVLLMLGAMVMYLGTMDESIRPGGERGEIMPAAPAPAAP